jgi:hypothetical protein
MIILSASRRTDLVGCYPDVLIEQLKKYPPDAVHTIVIWTKNPAPMLEGELTRVLSHYAQLFVHLTITGLGGTVLEPRIPPWQDVAALLPRMVKLVKSPQRIAWRFDPIMEICDSQATYSNLPLFDSLAERISPLGIPTCRVSWVSPYRKVLRRLENRGFRLRMASQEEKERQALELQRKAEGFGFEVHYCCVEGFPRSRCIDGKLLSGLHPEALPCSQKKAKGQRKLCGCTESLDIGWYSQKCGHGCLYCYAEPQTSGKHDAVGNDP